MAAIVDAPYLPASQVADQVRDNELVLGVSVGGAARAYPINMLTGPRREIVNDRLGRSGHRRDLVTSLSQRRRVRPYGARQRVDFVCVR